MIRRGILEKKYIFEYDVGQWTYGTIQVLKDKDCGELRTCRTVPKSKIKSTNNVLAKVKALQQLQHPHICAITDAFEDKDNFYIVSEYFQGGDVQDWLERLDDGNWLQEQTCAAYVRETILALAHCHASQVYHRDLRPSAMLLTTKLPDAKVKVADVGLAAILDPDNALIQEQPTAYTVPDILKTSDPATCAVDMWSIGAIAQALLVGQSASESTAGQNKGWGLTRSRKANDDEDAWNERSPMARDFVQRLLRPAGERPTAAKALNHPWMKGVMTLSGINSKSDSEARDLRHKTLCYTLAVILLPVIVPYRDFEQLRMHFQKADPDNDNFVPRNVAQKLLLFRCNLAEAVTPALTIVDVGKTECVDLCAVACADLIVREFFAAGPTGSPLVGPFRATDLAPRMLKRFFEVFGERRDGAPQPLVRAENVKAKVRTATARDVELHANVRYDNVLSCLPEGETIDSQTLTSQLSASAGRGTPLGTDGEMSPLQVKDPWAHTFKFAGVDVMSIFQACGAGSGLKREDSPSGIRMF